MADLGNILNEVSEAAKQAIHFDEEAKYEAAIYMYRVASFYLLQAIELQPQNESLVKKDNEYSRRCEALQEIVLGKDKQVERVGGKTELGRANFLLLEALELDENNETDDAIDAYSNAVELCLKVMKENVSEDIKEKLRKLADQALTRAEALREKKKVKDLTVTVGQTASPAHLIRPLGLTSLSVDKPQASSQVPVQSQSKHLHLVGKSTYSKEELETLRRTSVINNREYVPFMSVDLKEKFAYSYSFSDKDGLLALSPKQKTKFHQWCRPEDLSPDPRMIDSVDCFSVKQTCVSDCSFIASIAVSALYEKRFKKRLITDIIYPKDRRGNPIYNPCGKYMIKLHVNGIPRKVLIDDRLPCDRFGSLLCSYSTNKNEFWISLVEKAYMKVMGGYDFPGSNSNIDLYALTGWIPERVSVKDSDVYQSALFRKVFERFHKGDVLVTVATGEMSDTVADRAGLVSTHAYAMLDIREVKGKRLLMLKNPWSHLRWRGNYSELDRRSWTPELRSALNYDPKSAQAFDNGVFWIDWDSVCHFFDVLYMNWSPNLFCHTFCTHQTWKAGVGPARDLYNVGENPQYSLEVSPGSAGGAAAIWVLLTRHITHIEDFRNNSEYITLLVYKTDGKKVFYPFDPAPYIDGVRINSPHYLCKIVLKDSSVQRFTLVISQYEKQHTIHYSLRVYSTCPFSLNKLTNLCKYKHEEKSKWAGLTAGGCPNHPATYGNNPIYQFRIDSVLRSFRVELKAPKQIQIGFEIVCIEAKNSEASTYFSRIRSGSYRSGFCVKELENVVEGVYNVVPSTFYPKQEAPFYLSFYSSSPIKVSRLQ